MNVKCSIRTSKGPVKDAYMFKYQKINVGPCSRI